MMDEPRVSKFKQFRIYARRHWLASIVVLLVMFGGCSYGMLEYTHNPKFCISCHIMKPYYEAWETSSHNKVSCVECHYPPGLKYELQGKLDALNQVVAYWTNSYDTKFYAEIEDVSCMRSGCHSTRLIEGPLEFKRDIKFDHAQHYGHPQRGIELRCTSCHSQIVQGDHMAVTEFTCFLCHFKNVTDPTKPLPSEFCLTCHTYPQSYVDAHGVKYNHKDLVDRKVPCWRCHSDVIRGTGEVEDRACLQCHADPEQIKRITEVNEVHKNHVTLHKVECFNCHANIEHSVPQSMDPLKTSCEVCHKETHLGPPELYAGKGGRGVPDLPSPMFLAQVDCAACHISEQTFASEHVMKGTTMEPTVQACVDCHGEAERKVFAFWKDSIAAGVKATQPLVRSARARLDAKGSAAPASARQLVEDAEYNLNFVNFGKGMHNLDYSLALLKKAREDAQLALGQLGG
jgi:nitrate/TMAO reductase-like tetraheme cytochrome c subunit